MRINGVERPKIAIQKLRHELAEEAVVIREAHSRVVDGAFRERAAQQLHLGMLPRAIDSLEDDKFSARGHGEFQRV